MPSFQGQESSEVRPGLHLAISDRWSAVRRAKEFGATHVISIGSPGDEVPSFPPDMPLLRLEFDDTTHFPGTGSRLRPPMGGHVVQAVDFVRSAVQVAQGRGQDRSARLLVHCQAGESRSTAIAIAVVAALVPPLTGEEVIRLVADIRPNMNPNPRIIAFADRIISRENDTGRHELEDALLQWRGRRLAARVVDAEEEDSPEP